MYERSLLHNDPPPRRRRRRWPQILTILVLLIAAGIALLPFGLAYGLQRWLLAHGADQVEIGNVDFNPFTGTLTVADVLVRDGDQVALRAGRVNMAIDWLPLWERHLDIQRLDLEQALLLVERPEHGWRIGGLLFATLDEPEASEPSAWGLGVHRVELQNFAVQVQHPDVSTRVQIDSASLSRLATWDGDENEGRLQLQGRVHEAPLTIEGTLAPFAERPRADLEVTLQQVALQDWYSQLTDEAVTLEGTLMAHLAVAIHHQEDTLSIIPQGEWSIAGLRLADAERQIQAATVTWTGELELTSSAEGMRVRDSGRYRIDGLQAQFAADTDQGTSGGVHIASDTLTWDGELLLEERFLGAPGVSADGTLAGMALRTQLEGPGLIVTGDGARWQGSVRYGMQDVPTGYELTGTLEVRGPKGITADGAPLASGDLLRLRGIDAKGTYVLAAEELTLDGWRLLGAANGDSQAVLQGAAARMAPVALDDLRHFRAGEIDLGEVQGVLRRDAEGNWYGLHQAGALVGGGADPRTGPGRAGLRIDRLQVTPGSRLRIEDRWVSPPYASTLEIERLEIEDLDSRQPHRPSPMMLEGRLDKHAPVRVKGSLRPFSAAPDAAIEARIESLELPALSPYAAAALGYRIDTGQLDGTLDLKLIDRHLRGEADLLLRKLTVDAVRPDEAAALEQEMDMSLEAALVMLRDKQGDIRLEVPIRGELDNPEFRFAKVMQRALANTMRNTIVTGLKLSLQPFGAVVMAAEAAQNAAGAVRLEPLDFVAGSATLSPVAQQYLRRLAALLEERPALRIRICGIATPADRRGATAAQGDEALLELADRRATAVKDALTERHGAAAERLYLCRPRVDEGVPRVELAL